MFLSILLEWPNPDRVSSRRQFSQRIYIRKNFDTHFRKDFKMQKHFPVILEQDEDNVFIVSCPTLKGCHSYGHTLPEALENMKEAILLCLEDDAATENQNHFLGVRDLEIAIP